MPVPPTTPPIDRKLRGDPGAAHPRKVGVLEFRLRHPARPPPAQAPHAGQSTRWIFAAGDARHRPRRGGRLGLGGRKGGGGPGVGEHRFPRKRRWRASRRRRESYDIGLMNATRSLLLLDSPPRGGVDKAASLLKPGGWFVSSTMGARRRTGLPPSCAFLLCRRPRSGFPAPLSRRSLRRGKLRTMIRGAGSEIGRGLEAPRQVPAGPLHRSRGRTLSLRGAAEPTARQHAGRRPGSTSCHTPAITLLPYVLQTVRTRRDKVCLPHDSPGLPDLRQGRRGGPCRRRPGAGLLRFGHWPREISRASVTGPLPRV